MTCWGTVSSTVSSNRKGPIADGGQQHRTDSQRQRVSFDSERCMLRICRRAAKQLSTAGPGRYGMCQKCQRSSTKILVYRLYCSEGTLKMSPTCRSSCCCCCCWLNDGIPSLSRRLVCSNRIPRHRQTRSQTSPTDHLAAQSSVSNESLESSWMAG